MKRKTIIDNPMFNIRLIAKRLPEIREINETVLFPILENSILINFRLNALSQACSNTIGLMRIIEKQNKLNLNHYTDFKAICIILNEHTILN